MPTAGHPTLDPHSLFLNLDPELWIIILEIITFEANSSDEFSDIYIPILMVFPELNSVPRLKKWRVNKADEIITRTEEYEPDYWIVACTPEQYYEDWAKLLIQTKNLVSDVADLSTQVKKTNSVTKAKRKIEDQINKSQD